MVVEGSSSDVMRSKEVVEGDDVLRRPVGALTMRQRRER